MNETCLQIFNWFFASPTPIIAIASAIIAYLAYNHQRKLNKKNLALKIAETYAESIIPRMRYVASVMESIGCNPYTAEFTQPIEFIEQELVDFLRKKSIDIPQFQALFKKIKVEDLDKAFVQSGCNPYITESHKCLLEAAKVSNVDLGDAFVRFTFDLLNDIEAFASQFYYNVEE